MDHPLAYLTIEEVADYYRVEVGTVRGWRAQGTGPVGVHAGEGTNGLLIYPQAEIQRWDAEILQRAADARRPLRAVSAADVAPSTGRPRQRAPRRSRQAAAPGAAVVS
jgi:hypothetical protein